MCRCMEGGVVKRTHVPVFDVTSLYAMSRAVSHVHETSTREAPCWLPQRGHLAKLVIARCGILAHDVMMIGDLLREKQEAAIEEAVMASAF